MSWTAQKWRNGWLVLDRNADGLISDLSELFGNMTPQPADGPQNGYHALAVFDDPATGGNGNDFIDPGDSVYSHLRVWIDSNHDGVSDPGELHTLQELGIFRIALNYKLTRFQDPEGNTFRYKGRLWDASEKAWNTCYDVFLQVEPVHIGANDSVALK